MDSQADLGQKLEGFLKLDWQPVAVRFLATDEKAPSGLLSRTKRLALCQFVTAAGYGGYPFLMTRENLSCANARYVMGMMDPATEPEAFEKMVKSHIGPYAKDFPAALSLVEAKPAVPVGVISGVAIAPLRRATFTPDAVVLLGVPWQAYHALAAYIYATGETSVTFDVGANSLVCAYSVIQAGFRQRMAQATACAGGRNHAGVEKTQIYLSVPWDKVPAMVEGLEARSKNNPYPGLINMPSDTPGPAKHILQP